MECPTCREIYPDPIPQCTSCGTPLNNTKRTPLPARSIFNLRALVITCLLGIVLGSMLRINLFLLSLIFGILFGFLFRKSVETTSVSSPVKKIKIQKCPLCDTEVFTSQETCPGCNSILNFPLLKELDHLHYLLQELEKWFSQGFIHQDLFLTLKRRYSTRKDEILAILQPLKRTGPSPQTETTPGQPNRSSKTPEAPLEVELEFPTPGTGNQLADLILNPGPSPLVIHVEEHLSEVDRRVEQESGWVHLVQAFLDEKNIKWLGVLGALGVVVSSIVLVGRYWDQFPIFLRYFLMIVYTASFYQLGLLAIRKLELKKTGQILLMITVFLLPLNFIYLERLRLLSELKGIFIFMIGAGALTLLSHLTFKEILNRVHPYHLLAFLSLSVANTLLPTLNLQHPPTSVFVAFLLWLIAFIGIHSTTRFYLKEPVLFQKRYTFFVATIILYVYVLVLMMTLEIPFSWYGLILMMVSIPFIQTAHSLLGIFRQSHGPEEPPPIATLIPYLVGYGLSFLAYIFAFQNPYAFFFTALIGLGLYGVSAFQYKRKLFAYLTILSLGITYFYSPIFFQEIALRVRDTAAVQLGYQRLPYPFYGLTFIPFNVILIGVARWLSQRGEGILAGCFYRVGTPLSVILIMVSCFELKAVVMVSVLYALLYGVASYLFKQRSLIYLSLFCVILWVLSLSELLPIPLPYRGMTFALLGLIWLAIGFFFRNSLPSPIFSASIPENQSDSVQGLETILPKLSRIDPFPIMAVTTSLLALFFQISSTFQFTDSAPSSPLASSQLGITAFLLSILYGQVSCSLRSPFFLYVSSLCLILSFFSTSFALQVPPVLLGLFLSLYSLIFWGIGELLPHIFQPVSRSGTDTSRTNPRSSDSFIYQTILVLDYSALALSPLTVAFSITWGGESFLPVLTLLGVAWGGESFLPVLALLGVALLYVLAALQFKNPLWWYLAIGAANLAAYLGGIHKLPVSYRALEFSALSISWMIIGYGLGKLNLLLKKPDEDLDYLRPLFNTLLVLTGYATFLYINQIFGVKSLQGSEFEVPPSLMNNHLITAFSIGFSFLLMAVFFQKGVLFYPAVLIFSTGIYLGWIGRWPVEFHFLLLTLLAYFWGFMGMWAHRREVESTLGKLSISPPSISRSSTFSFPYKPFYHISLGLMLILLIVQTFWTVRTLFLSAPTNRFFWGAQLFATGLLGIAYLAYLRVYPSLALLYLSLWAFTLLPLWAVSLWEGTPEVLIRVHGSTLLLMAFIWLGIYRALSQKDRAQVGHLFLSPLLSLPEKGRREIPGRILSPFFEFSVFLSLGALLGSLWTFHLTSVLLLLLTGVLHLLWGMQVNQKGWIYAATLEFTLSFYYLLITWMTPQIHTFDQISLSELLPVLVPLGFLSLILSYFWLNMGKSIKEFKTFGRTTEFFYGISLFLSLMAGLCVGLSTLSLEMAPFDLILGVIILGSIAVLHFWLAYLLQQEWIVYLGELTLLGLYGYLRITQVIQTLFWGKIVLIGLSFFLLWVNIKTQQYRLRIFQRPAYLTSVMMPGLSVALAVWHSFSEESFYDQITVMNPFIIACAASYYALLAFQKKNREFAYLAAILYDGAMFLLWTDLQLSDLQFYFIPVGLTILFIAQIHKDSLGRENLSHLRSFGSLVIYASPAWSVVTSGSDVHALSLAILSFLGIGIGIALRIRAFLYLGTIFLVMDLLAQVVIQSYQNSLFKWLCILLTGILIILLAAFFERKREKVLQKIEDLAKVLESWE